MFSVYFEYIGLLGIIYFIGKLVYSIYRNVFFYDQIVDFTSCGKWAIVTGGSDGIGLAYANELAQRGLNLVLISNAQRDLERASISLSQKYLVKVKTIYADFTQRDESLYERIRKEVDELDIGVLVNNVGMGYKFPLYFDELCERSNRILDDMIACNCVAVTKMTSLVLPKMLANKRGVIVNVSSMSGRIPSPLLAVYSATKAYVNFFSRSIAAENASRGVFIQTLCPYFVATRMVPIEACFFVPTATDFVKRAIRTIGYLRTTTGYLPHELLGWLVDNFRPISVFIERELEKSRREALHKENEEEKTTMTMMIMGS